MTPQEIAAIGARIQAKKQQQSATTGGPGAASRPGIFSMRPHPASPPSAGTRSRPSLEG
jgi:hypothetical protein